MNTGEKISTHYGALDAFFPAELALSGDLDRAERLQESSYKMWTDVWRRAGRDWTIPR